MSDEPLIILPPPNRGENAIRVDLTRRRVVWTSDEKKKLDRAAKVVASHGDVIRLRCGSPVCPDHAIVLAEEGTGYRGRVLRCGCTDRVIEGHSSMPISVMENNAKVNDRAELALLLPRLKQLGVDGVTMADGTVKPTKAF